MEFVILIIVCAIVSNKIKKAKMTAAIEAFKKKEEQKEAELAAAGIDPEAAGKQREKDRIHARAMENVRPQQKEKQSTTDYLAQKAGADQVAHSRDSRQEEQRLRRETGGKAPAMRHYYGDSVPSGMRLVRCGYCAADNLVATHANVKNYTCYFCREDL